ncbi:SAM-dependent methyltransferase [Nitratireductor sp. CAU 1489]|uniref:SAM-dependent methyltransferase n=1 Tax=Nitratireductor arenosus TaxID=2682096 RepID=A0A844QHY8_9HYPH|nr:SAM-dependent methyltransferase [Nitratireductor arenosus]MVA97590.1 SAM-dependent methyltransferase [Nitratireductor arenosus]
MLIRQAADTGGLDMLGPRRANPYENSKSLEFGFRARRFVHIRRLIEAIIAERGSAEILDLGGTETYWHIGADFIRENRNRLSFTMVNTEDQEVDDPALFTFVAESASDPTLFSGRRFDLVHSNSVIEHVGDWSNMEAFAANARRLAPRYYIQTPNYWFAYEPHFRFPGFQYLPRRMRATLIMRFALGFFQRIDSLEEALDIIHHHRLLSTREMAGLFPDAAIVHEKVFGLNKSVIAIRDGT